MDYGTVSTLHQDFLRRSFDFQDVPALAFPVRLNVKPKCGSKFEEREGLIPSISKPSKHEIHRRVSIIFQSEFI